MASIFGSSLGVQLGACISVRIASKFPQRSKIPACTAPTTTGQTGGQSHNNY